ncbi:MAG: Flp pilus assembly protein CpaB [Beijerinckiaceae bacterium]
MRSRIIMLAIAAVFGVLSIFGGRAWLDRQANLRMRSMEANRPTPAAMQSIVVAASPLRYGVELTRGALREIPWTNDALPAGSFGSIEEIFQNDPKRIVLGAIEPNEPILRTKITGKGQRATLSAMLGEGMKAVTVRASESTGAWAGAFVAGFVMPGDHVDVIVMRQSKEGVSFTDLVAQGVRVLAVDQLADDRTDKPNTVKAVTLEAPIYEAQQIVLASSVGTLSLALRRAGELRTEPPGRVLSDEIGKGQSADRKNNGPDAAWANFGGEAPRRTMTTISVTRASQRQEYAVPTANPN